MNIKKRIINILLLSFWIVLGTAVLGLLIAAMNIKDQKGCAKMKIEITGVKKYMFLEKHDVVDIITAGGTNDPVGRPIKDVDVNNLERLLEKNVWVRDAELFFDNNMVLHVKIVEREPVARIFSRDGASFYIDTSGYRMPLSEKMTVRLPVFTNFPAHRINLKGADSLLISHIKDISRYIIADEFWMAQIEQVDITPSNTFEMIPSVGNHIIEFGSGVNYDSKFRRLMVFYTQVLARAGLTKYNRVSVEFDKQVVAKKGNIAKIDSVKAMKNIQKMIQDARKAAEDSTVVAAGVNGLQMQYSDTVALTTVNNTRSSEKAGLPRSRTTIKNAVVHSKKPSLNMVKRQGQTKDNARESAKPKAVMQKNKE